MVSSISDAGEGADDGKGSPDELKARFQYDGMPRLYGSTQVPLEVKEYTTVQLRRNKRNAKPPSPFYHHKQRDVGG